MEDRDDKPRTPPDNWFQTYTGKLVDVAHPDPAAVDILDIAQALSMTCRFGGHCRDFYSVAEHLLLVHLIGVTSDPRNNLALLLHDAAEAYVGDLVTPLKRVLRADELEDEWLRAIEKKLDLGTLLSEPSSLVKIADRRALSVEVVALFDHPDPTWWSHFEPPTVSDLSCYQVRCLPPAEARRELLCAFRHLRSQLG